MAPVATKEEDQESCCEEDTSEDKFGGPRETTRHAAGWTQHAGASAQYLKLTPGHRSLHRGQRGDREGLPGE